MPAPIATSAALRSRTTMAEQTSIEWTQSTWNPVTQCRKPNSARADVDAASGGGRETSISVPSCGGDSNVSRGREPGADVDRRADRARRPHARFRQAAVGGDLRRFEAEDLRLAAGRQCSRRECPQTLKARAARPGRIRRHATAAVSPLHVPSSCRGRGQPSRPAPRRPMG